MLKSFVQRRIVNGVLPQAAIAGSLSFSHIHDLADAHGQDGWKAWTYPLSVDWLTVAAYRKVQDRMAHPVLAWFWFLLSLAASLGANIVATGYKDPLSLCVGVWPSVAFLGCTFLGHSGRAEAADEPAVEEDASPVEHPADDDREAAPAPTVVAPVPQPVATSAPEPRPAAEVSTDLLAFATRVASDHQRQHGRPIDATTLRQRLGVTPSLAHAIYERLQTAAPTAT